MGKYTVVLFQEFALHEMNEKTFDQQMGVISVSHWSNKGELFLAGAKSVLTLTLVQLPGASEIYPWASKTTLRLAQSGNKNFCSTNILWNDLICNEESD